MAEPNQHEDTDTNAQPVDQTWARIARRAGYVVFLGGAFAVFIPMLIGVGSGIHNDRIWDPFTGAPVSSDDQSSDCAERGRRLLVDAGRHDALVSNWDAPYRAWLTRCKSDHPTLYNLLRQTRQDLRDQP